MLSKHRVLLLLIVLVLAGCAASAPLTMRSSNEAALSSARSVTIRAFSTEDVSQSYKDPAELAQRLATSLRDKLRALGVTAELATGPSDSVTTDLVVEGKFSNVDEGNASGRVLVGTGGATVAVRGFLKDRSVATVAEFTKSKTSAGGPLGMGGLLAGDASAIIRNNVDAIADELARVIKSRMKG